MIDEREEELPRARVTGWRQHHVACESALRPREAPADHPGIGRDVAGSHRDTEHLDLSTPTTRVVTSGTCETVPVAGLLGEMLIA
ncbi:hypothetical protein F0L68_35740 [Solihabitans fulvus]|uniref:Uncharacterized protein n=1 Tax=Solihabitans fulvus TaxID=1892852 RepID=A0A5B2WK02_9PSEU|nr:hypothetical protein [Solihabitans fulvus]KAA2252403.1 hypothetical protein F0L68_35740 [Solihabitans fulvus]